jgi:hypothetical protein
MDNTEKLKGKYPVISAIIATIAVGIAGNVAVKAGFDPSFIVIFISAIILLMLFKAFPEKNVALSRLTFFMSVFGFLSALAYVSIYQGFNVLNETTKRLSIFDCAMLIMGAGFITPIFEEMVVRRLLFLGICRWFQGLHEWVGFFFGAFITSSLFSIVHHGMEVYAFFFSFIMCFMTWKGIHTVNRSILHSTHNLTIIVIYLKTAI